MPKPVHRPKNTTPVPIDTTIPDPAVIHTRRMAILRQISEKCDELNDQGRKLTPTGGAIPVGGAHIDYLAAGDSLRVFLRTAGKGYSAKVAAEEARKEHSLWMKIWNSRRKDYQVHRCTDGQCSWIDWAERLLAEFDREIAKDCPTATPPANFYFDGTYEL